MIFFVRTTLDRELHSSYNQIDFKLVIDYDHSPVKSFITLLKGIDDECVILEDDLILCRDFKPLITSVIDAYPDTIINFFEDPHKYFTSHFKTDFAWNQCTYYPKGLARIIGYKMDELLLNNTNVAYDILERMAFKSLSIKYLVYRPCLVQHIDNDTLIQIRTLNRRTPYFIDYLRKFNICYDDAYTTLNLDKLLRELNNNFPH